MADAPGRPLVCGFCSNTEEDSTLIAGPICNICARCVALCNEILAEGNGCQQLGAREMSGPSLEKLRTLGQALGAAEERLRPLVGELRQAGVPWAAIGQALGVSRQAAWERFSGED
jgi:ATP-dependent Clp protease ATP-binding subunit ClpX